MELTNKDEFVFCIKSEKGKLLPLKANNAEAFQTWTEGTDENGGENRKRSPLLRSFLFYAFVL